MQTATSTKDSTKLHFPQELGTKLRLSKYFIQIKHLLKGINAVLLKKQFGILFVQIRFFFQHDEHILVLSTIKGEKGSRKCNKGFELASWLGR